MTGLPDGFNVIGGVKKTRIDGTLLEMAVS